MLAYHTALRRAVAALSSIIALTVADPLHAQWWTNGAGGNWDNNGNWAPGPWPAVPPFPYPNGIGATADFQFIPPGGLGPIVIGTGGTPDFIVGRINLEADGTGSGYLLSNTFDLILDNGSSGAVINVNPAGYVGGHVIDSDFFLNDYLTVNIYTTDQLTINGVIADWPGPFPPPSAVSKTLTLNGTAGSTLLLTGANSFTGAFRVAGGTLELQDPSASGSTTGGVAFGNGILGGGTLYLNGIAGDVSITEGDLHLAGFPAATAVIQSANGNNTINLNALHTNVNSRIATLGSSGSLTINAPGGIHLNPGGPVLEFATDSGTDLFIHGGLQGPGDLTKTGGGRAVLTQPGGWSGNLWINAGTLEIQDVNALGAPSQTTVDAGASLHLNTTGGTIFEGSILLNGYGTAGEGALYNQAGNNTIDAFGGAIGVLTDSMITTENGSSLQIDKDIKISSPFLAGVTWLTLNTLGPDPFGSTLTINGTISNASGVTGDLFKLGNGTAVLSAANSYDGFTEVRDGVLLVTNDFALGTAAVGTEVNVNVPGNGALHLDGGIVLQESTIRAHGAGQFGDGVIVNAGNNNRIIGLVQFVDDSTTGAFAGSLNYMNTVELRRSSPSSPSANLTLNPLAGSSIIFTGSINDEVGAGIIPAVPSTIDKIGDGYALFRNANDYHGSTNILAGILEIQNDMALGGPAAGTTAQNTGALYLSNNIKVPESYFKIASHGPSGEGAIVNRSGTNRLLGDIFVAGDSTIGALSGTLSLESTGVVELHADLIFTADPGAQINVDRKISDPSAGGYQVVKSGAGTVYYLDSTGGSAPNTYTGNTTVTDGLLVLKKAAGSDAIAGDLFINNSGTVRLDAFEQIRNSSTVSIFDAGVLDLNNNFERFTDLVMREGKVTTGGTGTLRVLNNITTLAAGTSAVITGNLLVLDSGGSSPNVIDVANGSAPIDLDVSTKIIAANGFVKTGAGTIQVSNTVTTVASIQIDGGTLLLGGSNLIDDAADMILNGGTFHTGGYSDTLGTLTLTANSTLDLGGSSSILHFANSSATLWTAGATLSILNWSGVASGGGTDQLNFGGTAGGLTPTQIGQIQFVNPFGYAPGIYGASIIGSGVWVGELVPIPETETSVVGLLLSLFFFRRMRRLPR